MELLIGKAVNYAASKTSAAAEQATSPELLKDGAVGIYYKSDTGALVLITEAMSLATIVAGAKIEADKVEYTFAVGTDTGAYILANIITLADVKRYFASEAAPAIKQVSFIGYDGVTLAKDITIIGGSGVNGAILNYDEASVGFEVRLGEKSAVEDKTSSAANLFAVDTKFTTASKVAASIVADGKFIAGLVSSGTIASAGVGTANILTKGSPTVTFGTSTTLVAGDLLVVNVDETTNIPAAGTAPTATNSQGYIVASVAGAVVTLDRPFAGETVTLSVITSLGRVTAANLAAGSIGLKIVSSGIAPYSVYTQFTLSARGVISGSIVTAGTTYFTGSGTYKEMQTLEVKGWLDKGFYSLNDTNIDKPTSELSASSIYDKYIIDFNKVASVDASNGYSVIAGQNSLIIAFPDAAYLTGSNEFAVKAILGTILGTDGAPITLIATGSDNGKDNNASATA